MYYDFTIGAINGTEDGYSSESQILTSGLCGGSLIARFTSVFESLSNFVRLLTKPIIFYF